MEHLARCFPQHVRRETVVVDIGISNRHGSIAVEFKAIVAIAKDLAGLDGGFSVRIDKLYAIIAVAKDPTAFYVDSRSRSNIDPIAIILSINRTVLVNQGVIDEGI